MNRRASIIDTHCHLQAPPLAADPAGVVTRARAAGVVGLVVPGVDGPSSQQACALAERFSGCVHAAIGWHPQLEDPAPPDLALLEELRQRPGVVAVGEIGLDREVARPAPEVQEQRFRVQLRFARQHGLPVLVHCRGAFARLAALLHEEFGPALGRPPSPGGILHAWPGSAELFRELEPLGFCVGVAGVATRLAARRVRRLVAALPPSRLVLETDAPYIGTARRAPGQVEPADLPEMLAAVAELHGLTLEEVAHLTTATATRVLRGLRLTAPEEAGAAG